MRRSPLGLLIAIVCALVISAGIAHAQNSNGSITGEVTDASGAVIPNATVIAHDIDTGVDTRAITNAAGAYHIGFLPAGRYQLTVQASGFSKANVAPFTLEVLQTATFNVTLNVGNASTSVNVSAAAPILETNSITQSSTFTANTIKNLPLNGLDFSAVTLYVPGAIDTAGSSGPSSFERSTYFTDVPNFNGNRSQANNYTLDGIDINEDYNNLISY